jgi:hypothetical protein
VSKCIFFVIIHAHLVIGRTVDVIEPRVPRDVGARSGAMPPEMCTTVTVSCRCQNSDLRHAHGTVHGSAATARQAGRAA